MENTRGHVTCREERERLSGGKSESYWDYKNIPHQLTVCNEPKYWCRDGAYSEYGEDIYSWSCLGPNTVCNEQEEKSYNTTGLNIEIVNNGQGGGTMFPDKGEITEKPLNESRTRSSSYILIIAVITSVTVFILVIVTVTIFIILRKRRNDENKKEVIDDNFYYGDDGDEYHQSQVIDNNDYYYD